MKFVNGDLPGVQLIFLEKHEDERGFFARFFCKKEFSDQGMDNEIVQINDSYSKRRGTLRGIHFQVAPFGETKIVRCLSGGIFDVVVDLRKNSPTFLQWFGVELSAQNRTMIYVPKGFGHSFLTLEDDTEVLYFTTEFYSPIHERCIRWDDHTINIDWPISPEVISAKDNEANEFSLNLLKNELYDFNIMQNL